jgi:hypothetical protein
MRRSLHLAGAVFVLRFVGLVAAAAPLSLLAMEPTDYERELIAERRSIVQLHLEMETDLTAGNGVQLTRSKRTIWQDGDKRRCDEIREYLDGKGVTEVPPHRFVFIETPEYLVFWNSRPQPPPFRLCAHFEVPSQRKLMLFGSPVYDARPIGLEFTFLLHLRDRPWDSIIATTNRNAPATVEQKGDQIKVSFTTVNDLVVEQFYEKRGQKHLLRSLTIREDKVQQRTTMECSYPDTLIGGFAFPDSIESKHVRDDGYVVFHEKSKIRLKSINEAIPRSRFSIATAELPPGTPVIGDAIPPELIKPFHHIQWDGEALVPVSNSEIVLGDANDKAPRF